MRFQLTGYQEDKGVLSLSIDATTLADAISIAEAQGLQVISAKKNWLDCIRRERHQRFDLLLFSQELLALLSAGLSLVEALSAIARKEPASSKKVTVESLLIKLREGEALSAALKTFPEQFPALYLALVAASERTGNLENALARFISYQTQMESVRKRVVSSSIYPILLIAVGGFVILFLMGFVVPRFSRIYADFGRDLPLMSRLLLHWGEMVRTQGLWLLMGLVTIGGIAIKVLSVKRSGIVALLMSRTRLGDKYHLYVISRFYRTLGMLLQGGIPIVSAIEMGKGLLPESIQPNVGNVILELKEGGAISTVMERHRLAPTVAFDLLRIGEKTGNLGEKMTRVADFYDEELSRWIEWFSRLFEPVLMLFIGFFIAFVVVLLYLPIFDLAGNLQ